MRISKFKGDRVLSAYGDIPITCANCNCQNTTVEIIFSILYIKLCDDCALNMQVQIESVLYSDYNI